MRVVITGGPGGGKTALIDELHHKGAIVPEVARDILSFLEIHEPDKFSDPEYVERLIETLQLRNFLEFEDAIFDRGMPDELAFRVHHGMSYSMPLYERCRNYRYDKVFILPFWAEIYKNDEVRRETPEQAEHLEFLITHAYISVGYKPIIVPKVSIPERVKFIEDNL